MLTIPTKESGYDLEPGIARIASARDGPRACVIPNWLRCIRHETARLFVRRKYFDPSEDGRTKLGCEPLVSDSA